MQSEEEFDKAKAQLLAGDGGSMDWFWHVVWVCFVVIPIVLLWIAVVVELFRRHDMRGWMKLLWLLFVLVFPVIGAITYIIVTWVQADRARDLGAASEPPPGTSPSSVGDLARLDRLRRSGVLTEEEFQSGRRAVLEGKPADPTPAGGTGGTP